MFLVKEPTGLQEKRFFSFLFDMEFFLNHTGRPVHYKEAGFILTLFPSEPTLKLREKELVKHSDVSGLKVNFARNFKISGTFEPGKNLLVPSDVAQHGWRSLKQRGALGVYSEGGFQMIKQDSGIILSVSTSLIRWDNEEIE